MKPLILLGHVAIVVLCVLVAMVLNGLFVATTYSVNGVDITRLSAAAMEQKLRTVLFSPPFILVLGSNFLCQPRNSARS